MSDGPYFDPVGLIAVAVIAAALVIAGLLEFVHRSLHDRRRKAPAASTARPAAPAPATPQQPGAPMSKPGVEVAITFGGQRASVTLTRNAAGQHLLRWSAVEGSTNLCVERNGKKFSLRDGECSLYVYPVCELVPMEGEDTKKAVRRPLAPDELPVLEELMLALLRDDHDEYTLVRDESFADTSVHPLKKAPSKSLRKSLSRSLTRTWSGFLGLGEAATPTPAEPEAPRELWAKLMHRFDDFGACPIHGLLLSNTDEAVELARRMFEARPRLLTLVHGDPDAPECKMAGCKNAHFCGEGTLHVAAVNRREDLLCAMLEAANALDEDEIEALYFRQAVGPFFQRLPMRHYGGTPLAYLACFGMKRALQMVLGADGRGAKITNSKLARPSVLSRVATEEEVTKMPSSPSLTPTPPPPEARGSLGTTSLGTTVKNLARLQRWRRRAQRGAEACEMTGFLPLHAVTANGLTDMFDWLVDLPGLNMDKFQPHRASYNGLNSLTRVARGKCSLKRSLTSTGPPDRMGPTAGWDAKDYKDLTPLQLACKIGDQKMFKHVLRRHTNPLWTWGPASEFRISLKEIDSANMGQTGIPVMFLLGRYAADKRTQKLLLDDYMEGFLFSLFLEKWNSLYWIPMVTTGINFLYLVALVAAALSSRERSLGSDWNIVLLCMLVLAVGETVREVCIYVSFYAKSADPRAPIWSVLVRLKAHAAHAFWQFKIVSFVLAIGALARRAAVQPSAAEAEADDLPAVVLFVMSIFVFAWFFMLRELFLLSPKMAELSTLLRTVNTIIGTDVRFWGVLTSFYAATFFICLLISHPFSEDDGDDDEGDGFTFGRMARRSATSLALLLMAGETHHDQEAVIGLGGELSDGDDEAASGRAALWAVLYFLFIVFATTLLLNLLIAMMNNTYQQTTNESTLQYRVEFARRVLRYELLSPRGINTRCGQFAEPATTPPHQREYYYEFREVLRNHENVTPEGGATLFEDRPNEQADELADRLSKQLPSMMKSAHLDMLANATNATASSNSEEKRATMASTADDVVRAAAGTPSGGAPPPRRCRVSITSAEGGTRAMEAATQTLPYRERPATAATIATAPTAATAAALPRPPALPRPAANGRPHGAAAAVEAVPPPGRLVNMVIRDGEVISTELLC